MLHLCCICSAEIAAAVTAANPRPVTLKMEKVYHPCILQTKKRYVGFAYEFPEQQVPAFDAKGIETVRCAAAAAAALYVVQLCINTAAA
jgi:DNA polymerase zeta